MTTISKMKPVKDMKKDLHPISLAPYVSKIAENFVICDHVKPTALQVPDDNQFGAVLKSLSTLALLEMLHTWTEATDGNGSSIRMILFDYRKAFDLIDHSILVSKLRSLSMISWIIDFLSTRFQRVKLVEGCVSEWGSVPSGIPRGTKLGLWLFILRINYLTSHDALLWKYVNDTTVSEVVLKLQACNVQKIVDRVEV